MCLTDSLIQILAEFDLTCGEGATKVVIENWSNYIPKILDGTDGNELEALMTVEKKLRPPGPGTKAISAFTVYEVIKCFSQ